MVDCLLHLDGDCSNFFEDSEREELIERLKKMAQERNLDESVLASIESLETSFKEQALGKVFTLDQMIEMIEEESLEDEVGLLADILYNEQKRKTCLLCCFPNSLLQKARKIEVRDMTNKYLRRKYHNGEKFQVISGS